MLEALLILTALYLPGHFLGRLLSRKGDGWAELMLLRLAAGAAGATPVLILLSLAGWFTVAAIVSVLGAGGLAAWLAGRKAENHARFSGWDLAALGLFAGSLALYARPAEYIINSRDPGVYTVLADKLARTGELLTRDPLVGAVSDFHFFVQGVKYPGFYILGENLVVPQFFPGPFAWLGLGNLAGGLWGSLYVAPVFGALAVGAAFMLGKELFGRWAGLIGAGLLAAGYTQVWWSRHPSSEIIAQFFILAGLWLAARFARDGGPAPGVLAGLLLGAAMLVRVDGFLAAAAIPALFGYDLLTRRPARRWLAPGIPLALFAAAVLAYLNTVGGRYLYLIYTSHKLGDALALLPYVAAGAALAAAMLWYVRYRWGGRLGSWLEVRGGGIALLAASVVAGMALWAYFVVPVPWESLPVGSRDFDAYGSQVLVRMVWFTTPVVAVLGLVGFLLAARGIDPPRVLLIGAFLAFGVLYTAVPNVAPDLPWATRRFVPAAFPALCLFAGYAAVEAGRLLGRVWDRRAGAALSTGLAALALGWTVYVTAPVLDVVELEGAIPAFEEVDRSIPEAEVVYVERPDGHDGTVSTLEYVYGRPALPYSRERFTGEVDELEQKGLLDAAVYVTADGGPAPLISGVDFREVGRKEVSLPRLAGKEGHEKGVPYETEKLQITFRIYEITEVRR